MWVNFISDFVEDVVCSLLSSYQMISVTLLQLLKSTQNPYGLITHLLVSYIKRFYFLITELLESEKVDVWI
jgi:hypothetical protein